MKLIGVGPFIDAFKQAGFFNQIDFVQRKNDRFVLIPKPIDQEAFGIDVRLGNIDDDQNQVGIGHR